MPSCDYSGKGSQRENPIEGLNRLLQKYRHLGEIASLKYPDMGKDLEEASNMIKDVDKGLSLLGDSAFLLGKEDSRTKGYSDSIEKGTQKLESLLLKIYSKLEENLVASAVDLDAQLMAISESFYGQMAGNLISHVKSGTRIGTKDPLQNVRNLVGSVLPDDGFEKFDEILRKYQETLDGGFAIYRTVKEQGFDTAPYLLVLKKHVAGESVEDIGGIGGKMRLTRNLMEMSSSKFGKEPARTDK